MTIAGRPSPKLMPKGPKAIEEAILMEAQTVTSAEDFRGFSSAEEMIVQLAWGGGTAGSGEDRDSVEDMGRGSYLQIIGWSPESVLLKSGEYLG
jgi:hypothetical protein